VNLLAATAWHPARLRSPADFRALGADRQGVLLEWLLAQELWRRAAIAGHDDPEQLLHWSGKEHEIDFVLPPTDFVEVKRGRSGPLDFRWFPASFPRGRLRVLGAERWETERIVGETLQDFLMGNPA
jgi:hypothetical protein